MAAKMLELHVDIESFSRVNLPKSGVHRYAECPELGLTLFQWAEDDGPVRAVSPLVGENIPMYVLDALTDPEVLKTGWNIAFERTVLAAILALPMPAEQWECTMVLAATLGLPLDLDRAGRALRIKTPKQGSGAMRYFCTPCKPTAANGMRTRNLPHHDPEKWADFVEYGLTDVKAEVEILQRCRKIAVAPAVAAAERAMWVLDQRTNDRGVRVDLTLAENAVKLNEAFKDRCFVEAKKLTGLDNPNSVAQLKGWLLQAEGLAVEELNKKIVPQLLKDSNSETLTRALQLRLEMAKTSVQKYSAMQNRACADGFFRGGAQFHGARTGRWAHRGVQLGNLPHNKVTDILSARQLLREGNYETLELLWGVPSFILSQLIRTAFIPDDEDSEFLVVDFSAIEARVLAWEADETWRLDVFRGDGLIYEHSASRAFGVPWSEFQDYIDRGKKHPLRQKGKVIELAGGFGGGEGAMVRMGALEQGLKMEELKPMIRAWRDASLKIAGMSYLGQTPGLWENMDQAAVKCVRTGRKTEVSKGCEFSVDKGILFMRLSSGRKLAYMQPRIAESKFGQACVEFSGLDQLTNQWVRIQGWHGSWVENRVQAESRDVLRDKLLRIDMIPAYRGALRFTVHDEMVLSLRKGAGSVREVEEVLAEPLPWAPGLPLKAEGFLSSVYRKEE